MFTFQEIQQAFQEGGWGMWPILGVFVVAVLLAFERSLKLFFKSSIDARSFMQQLEDLLQRGDVSGAINFCQQTDKPISRIIAAGLARSREGKEGFLRGMDEQAYSELPQIEKRTGYLALLGNVATLMGLFGTIIGLIHSFAGVAQEQAAEKATLLAAGISEAMNCTAFGLLAGISSLLAFSVLNGKTQSLIDEVNYLALRAYRNWKLASERGGQKQEVHAVHPIAAPESHLMGHVGLLLTGHGKGRRSSFASLQLTPLIDMFIVMVIFLLMSFSATGEITMASKDIMLPFASQVAQLDRVPVIAVTFPEAAPNMGVVTLDAQGMGGQEVVKTEELLESESDDWKIASLTEQLENYKRRWKETHRADEEFHSKVIIQSDQNIDFKILKKIMYSAGIAGYTKILFAVRERAKGGSGGAATE